MGSLISHRGYLVGHGRYAVGQWATFGARDAGKESPRSTRGRGLRFRVRPGTGRVRPERSPGPAGARRPGGAKNRKVALLLKSAKKLTFSTFEQKA